LLERSIYGPLVIREPYAYTKWEQILNGGKNMQPISYKFLLEQISNDRGVGPRQVFDIANKMA
jgi:hypothetical protein